MKKIIIFLILCLLSAPVMAQVGRQETLLKGIIHNSGYGGLGFIGACGKNVGNPLQDRAHFLGENEFAGISLFQEKGDVADAKTLVQFYFGFAYPGGFDEHAIGGIDVFDDYMVFKDSEFCVLFGDKGFVQGKVVFPGSSQENRLFIQREFLNKSTS